MAELIAKSPCDGLLPLTEGGVTVTELDPGPLTAIAPYRGKEKTLSGAVKRAHGLDWPAPGTSDEVDGARLLWFGHTHMLLMGAAPKTTLARHAALTDQSDAWAVLRIDGVGARDVLARLTPLDLRAEVFGVGDTARSDLAHMQTSITRVAEDAFIVMVFRSMAATLVHDLKVAMAAVAARG